MADDRTPGGVIDLTDVIEEGVPLESLAAESLEANIDELFSQDQKDLSSDLLGSQDDPDKDGETRDEEAELAAILKEVEDEDAPVEAEAEEGKPDAKNEVDELEALLAEVGGTGDLEPPPDSPSQKPRPESEDLADDDLDTILSEAAGETAGDGEALSEDDLDDLLDEAQASPDQDGAEEEPPKETDSEEAGPLSQDDLDSLLGEAGDAAPDDGETETEEPQGGEAEPLSQEDLDALLNGFDSPSEAAAKPAADPEPVKTEEEPLSQDDLDALLDGMSGGPAESPPPPPEPAPAPAADPAVLALLSEAAAADLTGAKPTPAPAAPDQALAGLDPARAEAVLREVAAEVFERVARELIPAVTEEVLTREIAALRQELVDGPD